jgi:membrane protein YdbS with pleckstrin-like domain
VILVSDIRLGIGYYPILITIVASYIYLKSILEKKFNRQEIIFSSLIMSIFLASIIYYLNGTVSTQHFVASQVMATVFFFLLVQMAMSNAAVNPGPVLLDGGARHTTLAAIVLLPAPALLIGDYVMAHISPRCTGAKCATFEFIFGSDEIFTVFYWLNTIGSVLLISGVVSIIILRDAFRINKYSEEEMADEIKSNDGLFHNVSFCRSIQFYE